jgi:hypothetical protein
MGRAEAAEARPSDLVVGEASVANHLIGNLFSFDGEKTDQERTVDMLQDDRPNPC